MELEEMQSVWQDMSQKLERQQRLTDQLIMEMTKTKYSNKFRMLSMYETTGTVVCLLFAAIILIYFDRLDTWYQQLSGVFGFFFLTVYPFFALKAIYNIRKINISKESFRQTLFAFAKAKERMLLLQKSNFVLSSIFVVISFILSDKIINNRDIFSEESISKLYFFPILIAFVIMVCVWSYKKYVKITNSAEKILKELEE